MHSVRSTAILLVIVSLSAASLLAQKPSDTKKTRTTPTVSTGGTTPTASEGSTAMAIRGRPQPGRARTIDAEAGVVTAQTDDRKWAVKLQVADRGLLKRFKPGDALTLDLVAGKGSVGGQACPITNLTSEIRFTARNEAEQLCAKTQADMNSQARCHCCSGQLQPQVEL